MLKNPRTVRKDVHECRASSPRCGGLSLMTCLWVSESRVSTVLPLCPKISSFFFSMLCLKLFIISFCCLCYTVYREQGWRSGESTRLPPVCPGFKSRRRRHMWVEFVVGSLLCSERFFSGYSGFPLSSKTNIPNSNSTSNQVDEEPLCGCATCKSLIN